MSSNLKTGFFGLIQDPTDERLFIPTKKVKNVQSTEVLMVVQTMARIIQNTVPNCVGLAAPQIGSNMKIIFFRDVDSGRWYCMVNPRIVAHSDEKVWGDEGCLSHPGITVQIARWKWVEVIGADPKTAKEVRLRFSDDEQRYPSICRIIQHEIDHLDQTIITMKGLDAREYKIDPVGQQVMMDAHVENLEHGYVPPEEAETI